jgi:hypothetical protein
MVINYILDLIASINYFMITNITTATTTTITTTIIIITYIY